MKIMRNKAQYPVNIKTINFLITANLIMNMQYNPETTGTFLYTT